MHSDPMTDKSLALNPALYEYLQSVSVQETEELRQLREVTAQLPRAIMQIPPEQGQFMSLLAKLINARKTIEIGVFTGYSTLVVALALPEDGKIIACDHDSRFPDIAKPYWEKSGVGHKIDLRIAPAIETLEELIKEGESGTFDFVFIDADKRNYMNYYELSLQLVRPGGLIAIDNVLWFGQVADPEDTDPRTIAIRELNQHIYQDSRVQISLLAIADGLTLAMKL